MKKIIFTVIVLFAIGWTNMGRAQDCRAIVRPFYCWVGMVGVYMSTRIYLEVEILPVARIVTKHRQENTIGGRTCSHGLFPSKDTLAIDRNKRIGNNLPILHHLARNRHIPLIKAWIEVSKRVVTLGPCTGTPHEEECQQTK